MKIRVLGCHGADMPGYKTSSFLINDETLLDAGTVTSTLTHEEQGDLKNIFLSHSHFDHIKDILFLADNLTGKNRHSINIISIPEVLDVLKTHVLNATIWPDFTAIPSESKPILKLVPIEEGVEYTFSNLKFKAVQVSHTVAAVGYIVTDDRGVLIYSGDTGPTEKIWALSREIENLKVVIIETSFPNRMEDIATKTGHLTANTLAREIKKFNRDNVRIYIYHIKPQYIDEIREEIATIKSPSVKILDIGDVLTF
jgi:ribonuclease BN (tRNA processing enzyme)